MAEAGTSDGSVGMKRKLDDNTEDDNAQKIYKTSSLGEAEEGVTMIVPANGDPEEGDATATTASEKLALDGAVPIIEVDTATTETTTATPSLMVAPPMASPDDPATTTTAGVEEAPHTVAGNGESLTMGDSSKVNEEATATITVTENASVDINSDNGATDGSSPPAGETAATPTNGHSLETTTTTTDNGSIVVAVAAGGGNEGDDETVTMVIPKKQSAAAALAAAAAALAQTTSGIEEASVPSEAAATLAGASSDQPVSAPRPAAAVSATSASKHNTTKTTTVKTVVDNPADEFVEEVDELLPEYVGRIIGKGGEMIRDLQARSGCKIDVDQNVAAGAPRIISYKGKRSKVAFAKQLIHLLSVQNVPEDNLPLGEAVEEILAVPATVVGKVIGRGKQEGEITHLAG
jgi:KH domain